MAVLALGLVVLPSYACPALGTSPERASGVAVLEG
jgi:hypothetical protein